MARVAKAAIDRQLEEIEGIVRETPGGASRAAIAKAYETRHGQKLSSRTLIRRLEQLLARQRIAQEGDSSSTSYRPITGLASAPVQEAGYAPLTGQATRLRDLVRKPMGEKTPVGYDTDWLFNYRPGNSWYLTKENRAHLHEVGRTPDENRPAGTFARDILSRLLIDLAWASSRLEGNTYSRLDTQNLLEFGQRAEGKDVKETQMILNHKTAIEYLVSAVDHGAFNRATILTLHAALSENLLADPADEGRLREKAVSISGTSYTPNAIPQIIRECFDRILATVVAIPDPFEQAFFMMVHVPYLQPFIDVNKRTSRLAANLPLIQANLCPLSFVDVSEKSYVEGTLGVYEHKRVELLRDVFVWAYERSCAQYRVVRDSVVQPDPLRMRYRTELNELVQTTVLAGDPPQADKIRKWAGAHGVPETDLVGFTERALNLLVNLHEGSAGRFSLRPSEFNAWKARFVST